MICENPTGHDSSGRYTSSGESVTDTRCRFPRCISSTYWLGPRSCNIHTSFSRGTIIDHLMRFSRALRRIHIELAILESHCPLVTVCIRSIVFFGYSGVFDTEREFICDIIIMQLQKPVVVVLVLISVRVFLSEVLPYVHHSEVLPQYFEL